MVDEADRLLRQAYQDWLPHVLAAISDQVPAPDFRLPAAAECSAQHRRHRMLGLLRPLQLRLIGHGRYFTCSSHNLHLKGQMRTPLPRG